MTPPSLESATPSLAAIRTHALDAMRQAAHVAEEARLLQLIAVDAFEDIRRVAQGSLHSVRGAAERVSEIGEELSERVRERPLTALAITLGIGVSIGILYSSVRRAPARRVSAA